MSRIPRAKREELSSEHQQIWDRINAVRTGGAGPYSMLLHVPTLAGHMAATEDYFRLNSALPDADREMIILTAARQLESHYPWTRHEIRAQKAGIRPEVIEAVRAKMPLEAFAGRAEFQLDHAHLDALRTRGLRIDSPKGSLHLPRVKAAADPSEIWLALPALMTPPSAATSQ